MKRFKQFIKEAKDGKDDDFVQQSMADKDIDTIIKGDVIKVRGGSKERNTVKGFLRTHGLSKDYIVEAEEKKKKKGVNKDTKVTINPDSNDV